MATAEAALSYAAEDAPDAQVRLCEWETVAGPCHGPYPERMLREIIFYDGSPMLICPNHSKVWERERGLYMKHIRVQ